jgi:hypothetical protein
VGVRPSLLLLLLLAGCAPAGPASDDRDTEPVDTEVVDTDPVVPPELASLVPDACLGGPAFDGAGFSPDYALDPAGGRLFPLLSILHRPTARAAMAGDAELVALAATARAGLAAAAGCEGDRACVRDALAPSASDAAGDRLAAVFDEERELAAPHLRPSGAFVRWADADAGELVRQAWLHTAATLLSTFDAAAGELTAEALDAVVDRATAGEDAPWFEPLRDVTLAALLAAGRDEALRYEPLAKLENAAALARLATLDLDRFPFVAVLVPGQGPTDPDEAISPLSILRADLAAARWKAGLAPFVVPSGGHVHPDRTRFAEAIEIKRYLMDTHGLPEDAILVDPYARHTTTNLRDVGRELLRYGFPPDGVLLVTSDAFQSAYIVGMQQRCLDELGYVPWRTIALLPTGTDSCATVARDVLFVDASDPLDP